jgi:hypothetical protein
MVSGGGVAKGNAMGWPWWVRLGLVGLSSGLGCVGDPPPLPPLAEEPEDPIIETVVLSVNKDVDILFVIDNSGSMGEEQATLAASFASFINVLERPDVEASYRIGVTTTDNGNHWCSTTGPEAGKLRLTSCRSRPTEFTFNGATTVEAFDEACAAVCPEEWTNIEIQATHVAGQDEARARNWLESIGGVTNLPDGLSTVQAFQCFGPQGIDGCGFESHLESMVKALNRSQTDDDDDFGFIRDNAILSIVHVTDEADCSFNNDWETIFLPEGNRVFWSDATAASPTSAVCWNSGVMCDGSECTSVNLDVDGNQVSDDEAADKAVLRPIDRYIDIVQALETNKQQITPNQEVLVSLIGGVNADGSVTYQPSLMDPQFQNEFGIGPGCQSAAGTAVPPVRERELVEAFQVGNQRNMFSICESDYTSALEAIAEGIVDQFKPACISVCVGDADSSSPTLEPACDIYYYSLYDEEHVDIPACDEVDMASVPLCFRFLTDDARSQTCVDEGWNAEVMLERLDDAALPEGSIVAAECEVDPQAQMPCD